MTHGVRQIIRFNWPFYVASTASLFAAPALAALAVNAAVRNSLYGAMALALFWTVASLGASWIVYDRSPLMQWAWVPVALGGRPRAWINVHAGLDESTAALRRLLDSSGRVFDIFDPAIMTERSIARARRRLEPGASQTESVDFRHLPAATASVDAALLLLSAHELRTHDARRAFFAELHRTLASQGTVIVAEHLRDWANFAAFGPGFLHFHSRHTWMRCFRDTHFVVRAEFSITPFVRVFVLRSAT